MINELFGEAIICWFIGTILGVIWEWKEKVILVIMFTCMVISIVFYFIYGSPYSEAYPWWRALFGTFIMIIGIFGGRLIGRDIFKK